MLPVARIRASCCIVGRKNPPRWFGPMSLVMLGLVQNEWRFLILLKLTTPYKTPIKPIANTIELARKFSTVSNKWPNIEESLYNSILECSLYLRKALLSADLHSRRVFGSVAIELGPIDGSWDEPKPIAVWSHIWSLKKCAETALELQRIY